MNHLIRSQARNLIVRNFGKSSCRKAASEGEIEKGYFTLKAKQEHFQKDDGKPVHLKGSAFDNALYLSTFGLCVLGLATSAYMTYEVVVPRTN